jgi:SSS family solute:Na+ symporter
MLASFGLFCLCVLVQVAATWLLREPVKDGARSLVWEHWKAPLSVKCGAGLSDYRVMSAVVLAAFVMLYIIFR